MKNSDSADNAMAALEELANSLIEGALKTGKNEFLLIGTGLLTLIAAAADSEESMTELNLLITRFNIKRIKKQSGSTDHELAMETLLRDLRSKSLN